MKTTDFFITYFVIFAVVLVMSYACINTFLKMNDITMKGVILIAIIPSTIAAGVVTCSKKNEHVR